MEGGKVGSVKFTSAGTNPITDEQAITVDGISIDDLNEQPQMIWDYDLVVFGTWDGNGARERYMQNCNLPNDAVLTELEKYLKKGYSVIAGHDSIGRFTGTNQGLGKLRDYFGIKVGGRWNEDNDSDLDANGKMMSGAEMDSNTISTRNDNNWKFTSKTVEIIKRGQIVNYPWNLQNMKLEVPVTHTYGNIATSDVWMRLVYDKEEAADNNHCGGTLRVGEFTHDIWECPYALEPHWDPFYYLTTKNNTAMIQTGHSNCDATEEETKIWANLIYYLKQRTNKTRRVDYSSIDYDIPSEPQCSCILTSNTDEYQFSCTAEDPQNEYQYRVEAYDDDVLTSDGRPKMIGQSNILRIDTASGVSHFVYHIRNSSTIMTQSGVKWRKTTVRKGESVAGTGLTSDTYYLNVLTVDAAGNLSPVRMYNLNNVCIFPTPSSVFTVTHSRTYVCRRVLSFFTLHFVCNAA